MMIKGAFIFPPYFIGYFLCSLYIAKERLKIIQRREFQIYLIFLLFLSKSFSFFAFLRKPAFYAWVKRLNRLFWNPLFQVFKSIFSANTSFAYPVYYLTIARLALAEYSLVMSSILVCKSKLSQFRKL